MVYVSQCSRKSEARIRERSLKGNNILSNKMICILFQLCKNNLYKKVFKKGMYIKPWTGWFNRFCLPTNLNGLPSFLVNSCFSFSFVNWNFMFCFRLSWVLTPAQLRRNGHLLPVSFLFKHTKKEFRRNLRWNDVLLTEETWCNNPQNCK